MVIPLAIAGGLISGLAALGDSPKEKAMKESLGKLESNFDWLKEVPFSKEEIMGELLPMVQQLYKGSADIAAGRIGSAIGESGVAGGQGMADYYMQNLAPVIARGQEQAAGAVGQFGQWYSTLDENSKSRFLQAIQLEMTGNQGLSDMTGFQKFIAGGLKGASIGAGMGADIAQAGMINNQASFLDTLGKAQAGGVPPLPLPGVGANDTDSILSNFNFNKNKPDASMLTKKWG